MTPELARLLVIAGSGLPGASEVSVPWRPRRSEWGAFSREVVRQRAWGLLAAADGGRLRLAPAQRRIVIEQARAEAARCLVLERRTLEVVRHLRDRGISTRVLKGPAVAQLFYEDPSIRSFSDVDLLVSTGAFDGAVRCLEELGATRSSAERAPGITSAISKGITMHFDDGHEIDLHRRLAEGVYLWRVEDAALWRHHATLTLAGDQLETLAPPELFVHACLGCVAAVGPRRVVALRDVAEGLRSGVDAGQVVDAARALHARRAVALAVERSTALLRWDGGGHPLVEWSQRRPRSVHEHFWLKVLGGEWAPPRVGVVAAAVLSQPDPRAAARYLRWQLAARSRSGAWQRRRAR